MPWPLLPLVQLLHITGELRCCLAQPSGFRFSSDALLPQLHQGFMLFEWLVAKPGFLFWHNYQTHSRSTNGGLMLWTAAFSLKIKSWFAADVIDIAKDALQMDEGGEEVYGEEACNNGWEDDGDLPGQLLQILPLPLLRLVNLLLLLLFIWFTFRTLLLRLLYALIPRSLNLVLEFKWIV